MAFTSQSFFQILCLLVFPLLALTQSLQNTSLPIVDLGYELHQGNIVRENTRYLNFSNIRYAAPPLGALRFDAPAPPLDNRSAGIQDGSFGPSCSQAIPLWSQTSLDPSTGVIGSEDCLFLDIIVPNSTFHTHTRTHPAPVIIWIYGGGFVFGSKSSSGSPIGLLERSQESEPSIWVSMNYRLGAFGFLNGRSLRENGTANVGLLDQRAALEWVQKFIHLFGGDRDRVTLIGESAGGGSIMHQMMAFGGKGNGRSLFQRAVLQSPDLHVLSVGQGLEERSLERFLENANVSSVEEARKLSMAELQLANQKSVGPAPMATFGFLPTVDGTFVQNIPSLAFATGAFDQTIKTLSAHNSAEGLTFADPNATTTASFNFYLRTFLPSASPSILSYISNTLYPPIFNGTQPYTTPFGRLQTLIQDYAIECYPTYISTAMGGNAFNYIFSVPPGAHAEDVPYTFFDENTEGNGSSSGVVNSTTAVILQRFITRFAALGEPGEGFPLYGEEGLVMNINETSIGVEKDPLRNSRCAWWQKGLFL